MIAVDMKMIGTGRFSDDEHNHQFFILPLRQSEFSGNIPLGPGQGLEVAVFLAVNKAGFGNAEGQGKRRGKFTGHSQDGGQGAQNQNELHF